MSFQRARFNEFTHVSAKAKFLETPSHVLKILNLKLLCTTKDKRAKNAFNE